jgi:outer membrane receptor for ferrienterochelin and colicin
VRGARNLDFQPRRGSSRERTLSRIAAALLLGAVVLTSGRARADERTEARAHFKKGMAAIVDGRYDAGIEELKKAYDILPHPNVLYNIARAYVDIGDLEDAIANYRRYLEGNPSDRDEVARIVASLEARIGRQQTQLLETQQAQGAGASVPVGTAPGGPEAGRGAAAVATEPAPASEDGSSPARSHGGEAPNGAPGATPNAPGSAALAARGGASVEAGELKTEAVFEETVVTASKAAQNPLDAPNSTSIITEQDIRLSGITKLPELLRRLAGVDVMETTGAQTEVSLRGFNQRLSNKVLVLVNGRSVYVDLIGATLWGLISIGVEEIERIEVVRGPGSALYGADAFNGVINIITKAPGQGGSGFNVGYGDRNESHGSIWASGHDNEIAYRLSAGYDYLPRWSREVPPGRVDVHLGTSDQDASQRTIRLDSTVARQFGKDVTVAAQGGVAYGSYEILSIGGEQDHVLGPIQSSDVTVLVNSRHLEARAFWNRIVAVQQNNAAYLGQSLLPARSLLDVVDGELRFIDQFETGSGIDHHLQVGAEYRLKAVQWTYQGQDETEHHGGLFVNDEVKLGKRVALVADYRADYVPHLDRVVQSARGSILVHPSRQSTVRAIVGTAFRTPTFLESYLDLPFQLPVTGGALLTQAERSRLQPEQILTTEIGYLNSQSDYFTLDTALFYNRANNLIEISPSEPITLGDVAGQRVPTAPGSATGLYPIFANGFENQCLSYGVYGAELGLRTFPIEGLDVYANYTLMRVQQDDSGCSAAQRALIANDARTSAHKVNAGIQVRTRIGVEGSVDFHYVSPEDWSEQVIDSQKQRLDFQSYHLPAYTLLNARVGYRFLRNRAEVGVVAFDLLDDRHREHPFGQIIDRRLMAFFTYRF